MVRILSDADVAGLVDLEELLPVVEAAFLAQGRGDVERPERPHFPVGTGLDPDDPGEPLGTGLVMPAYLHGADQFATKLVAVHGGNEARGLPTVHAQVALTDAATGRPVAFMDGTRLTGARTGCIGGLAARELADGPVALGLVGAGEQARWQARAIAAATGVASVRVYSPSDSRAACAADLREALAVPAEAVETPRDAVADADVVVTATTATEPVFPGEALAPGTVVVAIGAYTPATQELDETTMRRAARVYADVPEEVATIGDVVGTGFDPADLVPFAELLEAGRPAADDEIVVVDSVGTAVLDAAAAGHLLGTAERADVGTVVEL